MTPAHVDGELVSEGNTFGDETLFHHLRVPERPTATQEPLPIHDPVEGQI
jgi:hypothetical protein